MFIGLTKFKTSQTFNNVCFLEENEFYKGESNCEFIVIVVGGPGRGKALQASPSRQDFPLWEPFPPTNFFLLPVKVLVLPIVTWNGTLKSNKSIKIWTIKWANSQWNFKSFYACGKYFTRICNSWLQKPIAGRKLLVSLRQNF